MTLMISVIVPVYKVEKYLKKSIESILEQSYTDFELYLVDDGSPDKCGEICDCYAASDSRVKVIHKKNEGAAEARNVAMKKAKGKYFCFVDSDDWIEKGTLEKLVSAAEKNASMLTITGFCMEYYETGKFSSYDVSPEAAEYLTAEDFRENAYRYFNRSLLSLPVSKLYLAEPIREKQLTFPHTMWDDTHFNMDYLMDVTSVVFVPGAPYHYFRSRPGSETTIVFDTDKLVKKRREHFQHIVKLYDHWNVHDAISMGGIHAYYVSRLLQCIQEIAVHPRLSKKEKYERISEILNDTQTQESLKKAIPDSKLMRLVLLPMNWKSVFWSYNEGKAIGFVKNHMSGFFYGLRARVVHKARKKKC